MSHWIYVKGMIEVSCLAFSNPQVRYIIESVLEHLPVVSGSEGNMRIHTVYGTYTGCSSSHNEFGEWMRYRKDADCDGWYEMDNGCFLVIDGALRDRDFKETLLEFNKWMNRLAKRLLVSEIMVKISDHYGKEILIQNSEPYSAMYEPFSWEKESQGVPAWTEYLFWERQEGTEYPKKLYQRYFDANKQSI